MSTSAYIPRTQELNDALEKFHHAFINMLVGKTNPGQFVDKSDMYKAMQAASDVNQELARCDADTPTFDPLLDELKRMKPLYEDPAGHVPAKPFLRLADLHIAPSILRKLQSTPKSGTELSTGGTTTKVPAAGKQSNAKPATTKATTSKPATTTKPPASKADVGSKPTTIARSAGGGVPSKATTVVKRDDDSHRAKVQPRPVDKKRVKYVEIHSSDASSGEEGEEKEGDEEEESDEEGEEEEVVVKTRRKVVKSAAIITDEMDNDAGGDKKADKTASGGRKVDNNAGGGRKMDHNASGGAKDRKIPWSAADIEQAELDAEWAAPDRDDPCVVNWNCKDIRYGPLYWGSYNTPLAVEGPISKEQLTDRTLNPHDRDGHAKYILADVYDTPCRSCSRATPPKICVFAGLKPNPLGVTVGEEEKNAAACGYCKHIKRKCEEHSRGRTRQIIENPFHDHSATTRGGSAKGKAKGETKTKGETKAKGEAKTKAETIPKVEAKVTPAAKNRGSRRLPAEHEVTMGTLQSRIVSLEKTCEDLAKKIEDMERTVPKLIKSSVDKMKLNVKQLEQDHKSTKAYVEQKTCSAMEALGGLGNAVHETLESIVQVLDDVPDELRTALQNIAERPDVGDVEEALEGIRGMQVRWAELANLVEGVIPKSKQLKVVAEASTPPPPELEIAAPSAMTPHSPGSADAAPTATIVLSPPEDVAAGDDKVDVEMLDVEAEEVVDGAPSVQGIEEVEESTHTTSEPSAGLETNREIAQDGPASPADTSNGKRKLDDDADEGPVEKKKKKSAAPKKKGATRRKGRGKGADAEATPAQEEDIDAEGEQVEE